MDYYFPTDISSDVKDRFRSKFTVGQKRLRSALHLIASQKHLDPIWTTFARKVLEETHP